MERKELASQRAGKGTFKKGNSKHRRHGRKELGRLVEPEGQQNCPGLPETRLGPRTDSGARRPAKLPRACLRHGWALEAVRSSRKTLGS